MLRKSSIKVGFIFLLIVVTIGQISYLFYQKLTEPEFPQTQKKIRLTSPKANRSFDTKQGEKYLLNLIIQQTKQDWEDYTDGITILKSIEPDRTCYATTNCFEVINKGNGWHSGINKTSPLSVAGPFMVRLAVQNQNDAAGIVFQDKPSPIFSNNWWRYINIIFIGLKDGGKGLYIDARDGSSPQAFVLVEKTLEKKVNMLNIFFDQAGQTILITDEEYKPIEYINLNKATNNRFPQGLFSEGKVYLGFGVAPESYLLITEFVIVPLNDQL